MDVPAEAVEREQAAVDVPAAADLPVADPEPAAPEPLLEFGPWSRPRWEQRLAWQAALAAGLLLVVLLAQRQPSGPMAAVVAATDWALTADASPALSWQRLSGWLRLTTAHELWEVLMARGLTVPLREVAAPAPPGGQPAATPAAAGAGTDWVAPLPGAMLSHGVAGAEWAAVPGTPVQAPHAGVVRRVLPDALAGTGVEVEHLGGAVAVYRPLTGVRLTPGAVVRAGDALGRVAATGRLHLDLRVNGQAVDPALYLARGV